MGGEISSGLKHQRVSALLLLPDEGVGKGEQCFAAPEVGFGSQGRLFLLQPEAPAGLVSLPPSSSCLVVRGFASRAEKEA